MIKRQFYSLEHRSRDSEASSASSSSSSSAHESGSGDEEAHSPAHEEEEERVEEASSPGPDSGTADDNKGGEEDDNSNLAPGKWKFNNLEYANDSEENLSKHHRKRKQESSKSSLSNQWADLVAETLKEEAVDFADECVVSCKKVLKCRLCPKTICLTNETMQAHLASKKHSRSLKHMKEGKLKVMLNSDGEEEEQGETHAERHARTVASFKKEVVEGTFKRKSASGRQRQHKRAKKKALQVKKL